MGETANIQAISASFQKYQEFGAQSTEKLKPIHKFLADTLQQIFGNEYELHYLGSDSKEKTVEGKYYPKNIDMTITKENKPIFCVGLKFVTSNYKQNANNYFENMMGETANIQANTGLPYAHVIILRHETPYYKKGVVFHVAAEWKGCVHVRAGLIGRHAIGPHGQIGRASCRERV